MIRKFTPTGAFEYNLGSMLWACNADGCKASRHVTSAPGERALKELRSDGMTDPGKAYPPLIAWSRPRIHLAGDGSA
jgi:hypothetical protein